MAVVPTNDSEASCVPGKQRLGMRVTVASGLNAGNSLSFNGLYGSSRAYFLANVFSKNPRHTLVILPDDEAAELFSTDLAFFLGRPNVALYPSTEVLPFDTQTTHPEIRSARIALMSRLMDASPVVVVTSAHALAQRIMPKGQMTESSLNLVVEEEYERNGLIETLAGLGYRRMSMVEERGEISVRGSIIDIFPPAFNNPLRIEFYGDLIESIRPFEISSQRSSGSLTEALILPGRQTSAEALPGTRVRDKVIDRADELSLKRGVWEPLSTKLRQGVASESTEALLPLFYETPLSTLFDYLDEKTIISILDSSLVNKRIEAYAEEVKNAAERMEESGRFFVEPDTLYMVPDEIEERINRLAVLRLEPFEEAGSQRILSKSNRELTRQLKESKGLGKDEPLKPLAEKIKEWLETGTSVTITAHNKAQSHRTAELLEGYGLKSTVVECNETLGENEPGLRLAVGTLSSGFFLPDESLAVVAEEEIFGERAKRRAPPKKKLEAFLTQLQDLATGDHIVHAHHGVALYRGLKRLEIDRVESDFLLLEYAGGDKLYLPVWRMDLISRYHAMEGRTASLDRLGGTGWAKATGKVKHAVEQMAVKLLKLYSEREVAEGFSFSAPDTMFEEFEAGFEYEETPDQARAITECLTDMRRARPMDRLVCGDVGYGKTEVAIRAAFKAVQDSKQVAVLVPTTVLATQHYLTFKSRLAPYPAKVEVLSRFKSRKEQNETIERLGRGEVDILIGTHRLLQKDVSFKDLGMIVIDEEHRFGVAQKERLKQLRKSVDVLTLTATPIPRTLHMSFASIRDLSIINTPPEDRLAIKTRVIRFDEEMIAEAIQREMSRGGQVFFVHNRIQSMPSMLTFLERIVPGAKIVAAHGQMKERELEKKMLGFVNGEIDVLLSTAIIESGLDIPSANTIIINRADRFGLAELYQLRGRVGRSSHRAYAYFICPDSAVMSTDARKRIEVIEELSDPGSGFKIATYDLEIRGAGELLGTSQSGSIAAVGFEMYTQLLEEAVMELQGKKVTEEVAPEINLKVSQYLPEEYIADTRLRLGLYKRLAGAPDNAEIDAITDEMEDRFGELPELVENLIRLMRLKVSLKRVKATELVQKGHKLYLRFATGEAAPDPRFTDRAIELFRTFPATYTVTPDSRLVMSMNSEDPVLDQAKNLLKELLSTC